MSFACIAALASLPGCNDPIDLIRAEAPDAVSAARQAWNGPHALDLGDWRDPASGGFYSAPATANRYSARGIPAQQSFGDYRLAGWSGAAALTASFYDGSRFRALGRIYTPWSRGGSGWAGYGPYTGFIDVGGTSFLDFASAFDTAGNLMAVFSDGATTSREAAFSSETTWDGYSDAIGTTVAPNFPTGSHPDNGRSSALAWDSAGRAYLAYVDGAGVARLLRRPGASSWSALGTLAASNARQVELVADGLAVTALWLEGAASAYSLKAAWSADAIPFGTASSLSGGHVPSMASATDGQGTVVAVFVQRNASLPPAPPGTVTAANHDYRAYATVRGASGDWTGATQLDDPNRFDPYTTTMYQNSLGGDLGGIDWPTPAVAYLGGGRFAAAFALTDTVAGESAVYVREFSLGTGWDPIEKIHKLDSMAIPAAADGYFRYANDFKFVSDGQGKALLLVHAVVPASDGADQTDRSYAIKAYPYSTSGGWSAPYVLPGSLCSAPSSTYLSLSGDRYSCWNLKPEAFMFPGGEAVVVYPGPAASSGTYKDALRLYSMEYRP